jgi:hypothetical protein
MVHLYSSVFFLGAGCESYAAMQQKQGSKSKILLQRTLPFVALRELSGIL